MTIVERALKLLATVRRPVSVPAEIFLLPTCGRATPGPTRRVTTRQRRTLTRLFIDNFKQYASGAGAEVPAASPSV
jgi:hypothetical protein